MAGIRNFFKAVSDWLFVGKRLPILVVALILILSSVTVTVVYHYNSPETELVSAYVTIKGFGDDVDFENRQIRIEDGTAIADIFSLKYESIYESFGRPLIQYNAFKTFMGVRADASKSFHVTIDGMFDNNLSQAYVYEGQTITVSYY